MPRSTGLSSPTSTVGGSNLNNYLESLGDGDLAIFTVALPITDDGQFAFAYPKPGDTRAQTGRQVAEAIRKAGFDANRQTLQFPIAVEGDKRPNFVESVQEVVMVLGTTAEIPPAGHILAWDAATQRWQALDSAGQPVEWEKVEPPPPRLTVTLPTANVSADVLTSVWFMYNSIPRDQRTRWRVTVVGDLYSGAGSYAAYISLVVGCEVHVVAAPAGSGRATITVLGSSGQVSLDLASSVKHVFELLPYGLHAGTQVEASGSLATEAGAKLEDLSRTYGFGLTSRHGSESAHRLRAERLRAEPEPDLDVMQDAPGVTSFVPSGFVTMDVLRAAVEVLVRDDGGRVVLVRDPTANDETLRAERRLALKAAAPAGYLPVHGQGRGGYLLIGDLAIRAEDLHAVLMEKELGSHALYLPICEIASAGFVRALAAMQNKRAAGSTKVVWVDPKTGTTVSTSPDVGLRVRPKPGAPDGDFAVFDPAFNTPVGFWARFKPGRVWRCRSGPRWPGFIAAARARRSGRRTVRLTSHHPQRSVKRRLWRVRAASLLRRSG